VNAYAGTLALASMISAGSHVRVRRQLAEPVEHVLHGRLGQPAPVVQISAERATSANGGAPRPG